MSSSTAKWHIPDHVIYVKNIGDLTPDDFRSVDADIIALMRSAPPTNPLHVLVDCTEMGRMPDIRELEFGRILKYFREPRCSWTVIIDNKQNRMLRVGSSVLTSLGGKRLRVESSVAAGMAFLRRADPLLVELADDAPAP